MRSNTTFINCEHESWCSNPETYCRYVEKMEILDKRGNVTEVVEPGSAERDAATITCVECGKEAWYDFDRVADRVQV